VAVISLARPVTAADINFINESASIVSSGTPIFVDLEIDLDTGALDDFDFATILIGTDDATDLSFVLDSAWTSEFESNTLLFDSQSIYAQEVDLESFSNDGAIGLSTILIGNLEIDTTGMSPGIYSVLIDNNIDDYSEVVNTGEGGASDPLFGSFEFTILPEPVSVTLLALGIPVLARRRWRS